MTTVPVFALLALDLVLFLAAIFVFDKSSLTSDGMLLNILFFCSGMPALVYQIVWERALFAIYGVNAESVAVIVSAFMLGLGLGAIVGGKLSARFPRHGIILFAFAELGTAVFGLFSLPIFHWAAKFSAGVSLPYTVVLSLMLLIVPTVLMGATLPLLVEHLVRFSGQVGHSVAILYFANTFGSAAACAFAASFLLRDFGAVRIGNTRGNSKHTGRRHSFSLRTEQAVKGGGRGGGDSSQSDRLDTGSALGRHVDHGSFRLHSSGI
jgi:predicted membrane-bound spermidine synthase